MRERRRRVNICFSSSIIVTFQSRAHSALPESFKLTISFPEIRKYPGHTSRPELILLSGSNLIHIIISRNNQISGTHLKGQGHEI